MDIIQHFVWSVPLKQAIVNGDATATGMEALRMNVGLRTLPIDPATKKPLAWLTPNGVLDATSDPVIFQQWMALASDAGVGLVPGTGFAVVDDDHGTLDPTAYGIAGTFAERTPRGTHYWTCLPRGRQLRKARLPDRTGDVITGDRAYVAFSPTPNYSPVDLEAPVLVLPDNSPLWQIAVLPSTAAPAVPLNLTAEDHAKVDEVVNCLLKSTDYGETVHMILFGGWESRYPSRSEADAALAMMATHHLRKNRRRAQVVTALLYRHSLKVWSHPNPAAYVASVVRFAENGRDAIDVANVNHLRTIISGPPLGSSGETSQEGVYDPKSVPRFRRAYAIEDAILRFAATSEIDIYTRPDRWRRLPVKMLADVFNVSGEAIRQRLASLKSRGVIERRTIASRHDGNFRRDSLVRLPFPVHTQEATYGPTDSGGATTPVTAPRRSASSPWQ